MPSEKSKKLQQPIFDQLSLSSDFFEVDPIPFQSGDLNQIKEYQEIRKKYQHVVQIEIEVFLISEHQVRNNHRI